MESVKYLIHKSDGRPIKCCLLGGRRRTTDMPPVEGVDDGIGYGVHGSSVGVSIDGEGVVGFSSFANGVFGSGSRSGVYGFTLNGIGVRGLSYTGHGVLGLSASGDAVRGK